MAVRTKSQLKEFGSVIRGVTFDPEKDFRPIGSEYSIELLRSNNIQESALVLDNTYNLSLERVKSSQILIAGDILICMANGSKELVGKSAYIPEKLSGRYTFGSFMGAFRPHRQWQGSFLKYVFQSKAFRDHINLILAGSSINNLTPALIENFSFEAPDLDEQKAIAEALSDIDELINSLRLELNKKVLLLDALRCELIPNNFLNSNLPVGWEVKKLGDVGSITGAGVDKVIRTDDKIVQLVNYMDVYRNLFIDEKIDFMNTTATQAQIQNCDLNEGDVLFTPTSETPGDIAQSAVIKGNLKECVYSYHLVRFRPKITFNVEYLAHCFNLADFKRQTLRAAEGSGTRYVITLPRFRNLEFPFPDLAEQERIGRCLSEASEEVSNAKMLLAKYLSIKQGMMNVLLKERVRLV